MTYYQRFVHIVYTTIFLIVGITFFDGTEVARILTSSANHHNQNISNGEVPRDIRIAFLGDSISRYHYLSLASYIHYKEWLDDEERPSFVIREHFQSWTEFYNKTNEALYPHELCDCSRDDEAHVVDPYLIEKALEVDINLMKDSPWKMTMIQTFGNRYFFDKNRNNALYYIQAFGHFPILGHYDADEVSKLLQEGKMGAPFLSEWTQPKWQMSMDEVIEMHLAKLNPKPDYVIINAGMWEHKFDDAKERQKVADALKRAGIIGIYRTTSKFVHQHDNHIKAYERLLCRTLQNCLDFSWTGPEVDSHLYVDKLHFVPSVYQRLNLQLLNMIEEMKSVS